jgi:hypothetical protein
MGIDNKYSHFLKYGSGLRGGSGYNLNVHLEVNP